MGIIAISAGGQVSRSKYIRDVCTQILALTAMMIVGLIGHVNIYTAFVYFLLYGVRRLMPLYNMAVYDLRYLPTHIHAILL